MGIKLVLSNDEAEKRNSREEIRRKRMTSGSKLIAEAEQIKTSVINTQMVQYRKVNSFHWGCVCVNEITQ